MDKCRGHTVVIDKLVILWAIIWAVFFLSLGTIVFWRAEATYGDV